MRKRIALFLSLVIGAIGAIGQAFLLRHELIDRYPYKVMDPYSKAFGQIGEAGAIIAPIVAIAVMLAFIPFKRVILPAVPVVVCPLAFWAVFM